MIETFQGAAIALLIGLLLGLERERSQKQQDERLFAGIRTFPLLSLAGFPFTGGFVGKVSILLAAVDKGLITLAVILVLSSLLSYWYYLRVAWYMWFRDPGERAQTTLVLPGTMKAALVVAALAVVLLGILPNNLLKAARKSAGAVVTASAPGLTLGR